MDRRAVHEQWKRDRATFHALLASATAADLRRRSRGTRWTNRQLLFHMLFGYQVVRALLPLVRIFGRLPEGVSRAFARALDAATVPFDAINYLGSVGGGLLPPRWMGVWFDHIIAALDRGLDRATDANLQCGMHYPNRWDPFFRDYMTLADVYRYPARHFAFHHQQLSFQDKRRAR
ncbi:MAG TPA: DinB family protein [Amycolatopsis sp.]|uniref:DinB family protein n=1 Tax=Amycolatopsis sp. TaxID=37632 RepID=UPI002B49A879|nr:DinB family protein [Amycolatopsis sp.]HKS47645.1 DinB family protein [Amycolatopsis sp.]